MPELPEVETVARGLRPLTGSVLETLEIYDRKVWFESELPPEALHGRRLTEVGRRGKYLLFRFEGGPSLVQHLRMTGKMLDPAKPAIPGQVRASLGRARGKGLQLRCLFRFAAGKQIVFYDTRRFGTLGAVADEEAFFRAKGIAPDPIATPAEALHLFCAGLAATSKPLKAALLDQTIVAGVGNIYADEALFASRLHPKLAAAKVRAPEKLWTEILRLLERSITLGGTTIRDYVSAEGQEGEFAGFLMVYGRTGEPCKTCCKPIKRIQLGGRSTHFCPNCQPVRAR